MGNLYQFGWFSTGRDKAARFSVAKAGASEGIPALSQLAQRYHQIYKNQL
ncbi:hypothetical protein ACFLUO_02900 [Chloroflexota bacterium]